MQSKGQGWRLLIGVAAVASVSLAMMCRFGGQFVDPLQDSYPDAPYVPFEVDAPRLVGDSDPPLPDAGEIYARYHREQRARYAAFRQAGALSRATAQEQKAWDALFRGEYVNARDEAENILTAHPDSVVALIVAAQAQKEGEGNLTAALHIIRKGRHILERAGKVDPTDRDARELYFRSLLVEHGILYDLDRQTEALRVVELQEQLHGPMPQAKFWHLLKLDRRTDAEAALTAMEQSGRWKRSTLAFRQLYVSRYSDRRECYAVGKRQLADSPNSPVLWSNFGELAQNDFRLEEAEEAYRRAATCDLRNYNGTPYTYLACLDLRQGRWERVLDDFHRCQVHRSHRYPATLQYDQADVDRACALFLLATGHDADALRFARRSEEAPLRLGNTSTSARSYSLYRLLVLWSANEAVRERRLEVESAANSRRRPDDVENVRLASESRILAAQILHQLARNADVNLLRPYLPQEVQLEAWMLGQFVQAIPSGIARELLRRARASEMHSSAAPYFDALEAETSLVAGDADSAWEFACRALQKLPAEHEKLLCARVNGIAAEAAHRRGDAVEARRRLEEVLDRFPAALRLLKLSLPIRIETDDDRLARGVAEALRRSPRRYEDRDGFLIRIRRREESLRLEFCSPAGTSRFVVEADVTPDENATVAALLERFTTKLYSPAYELTSADIHSLDRSPTSLAAQRSIDGVLNSVKSGCSTINRTP